MPKTTSTIDYSKWDKMSFSDDEDDESSTALPRVTRLDEPSRVTCAPDGSVEIHHSRQKASVPIETASCTSDTRSQSGDGTLDSDSVNRNIENNFVSSSKQDGTTTSDCDRSKKSLQQERKIELLTKNGGTFLDPKTDNMTYWSQDRNEVILSIAFDFKTIRSKDIRVSISGALTYRDRCAAMSNAHTLRSDSGSESGSEGKGSLNVVGGTHQEKLILQGELPYFVHLPEAEEDVDWEIDVTDPNEKLIKITFLKAVPMQGIVIWWSRPLVHFPEIDVIQDIDGRGGNLKSSENSQRVPALSDQDKMKKAWEEAHTMFREKMKKKQERTIID
jgi:hypothetical protein